MDTNVCIYIYIYIYILERESVINISTFHAIEISFANRIITDGLIYIAFRIKIQIVI